MGQQTKNLSIIFTFIFVFLAFSSIFNPQVIAQEERVGKASFEQNQLLVRYTDEAEKVIFSTNSGSTAVSTKKKTGILDSILNFLGLAKVENRASITDNVREAISQVDAAIGIQEQISLEALSAPKTIKLGKAKITPGSTSTTDPLENVYLVKFSRGSVENAVNIFLQSGLVTEAQPNFVYQTTGTVPNDPRFSQMWNLQNIRASDAWDLSTGSDVVVAVVDSGVDYNHPDLADNMWTGPVNGQTAHGWDFVDNDPYPNDENGHGTHVAGTIGAVGNNGEGVVGINWRVKIMAVRVIGRNGRGSSATVAQGVRFAADNGAKVINMSLGAIDETCGRGDQITAAAISYATDKGSLSVVAAGNNNANAACFSPANHPDVLAVSAVGPHDEKAVYSNYGLSSWKDTKIVAAPGGNAPGGSRNCTIPLCILSTWPAGRYNDIEGTSMAAPHVAGLAALVLSKKDMGPADLRQHLINTADDIGGDFVLPRPNPNIPGDDGRRSLGKRINAYRALNELSGQTAAPTTTQAEPTATLQPGQPTPTQVLPTATPIEPTAPPADTTGEIAIWTTAWLNGREVKVANGSKLPKGTPVSILYNRAAGFVRLTIDRGGGLVRSYSADCIPGHPIFDTFCQPRAAGFLHAGSQRFFPLGELASPEGSPHVYTLESGGKSVSTTIYVTTGAVELPTRPTSTPSLTATPVEPTVTPSGPTETPSPTVTPDPNATLTPTPSETPAGVNIESLINQVSEEKLREYLKNLVDNDDIAGEDERQTRYTYASGNRTEAEYIANHFQSLGIEQEFQEVILGSYSTRNIIGRIKGTNVNQFYLVTAHMDSMSENPTVVAPGADDNGSGTAAVMEAARVLKQLAGKLNSSLEFVLFSAEEQGLYGSQAYVQNLASGKQVKGVINLDMIANQGGNDCFWTIYKEVNRDKFLADTIVEVNQHYNIGLTSRVRQSSFNASDHAWFWARNIPTVFSFECSFSPVYHSSRDTTPYINFSQLTKITKVVVGALAKLATE